MTRPIDRSTLNHAIKLYLAGKPVQQISAECGISVVRLNQERVARGIPSRKERSLPEQQIIDAYLAGASEYGLSQQYGVSRGPITRILTRAGVKRRDMSEAGLVRNAGLTPEDRKRQVSAANRAARMRTAPQVQKLRHALLKEARGESESHGEDLLHGMLIGRGVESIRQRAIGVYNVDLAVPPVAVEVLGGGWHAIKSVHGERTPYILDEGWHLIMAWDYEGRSALGSGAADYLVTFFDEIRRNPPATSQYRVISGNGELLAACGREDNEFPLEPPPRSAL